MNQQLKSQQQPLKHAKENSPTSQLCALKSACLRRTEGVPRAPFPCYLQFYPAPPFSPPLLLRYNLTGNPHQRRLCLLATFLFSWLLNLLLYPFSLFSYLHLLLNIKQEGINFSFNVLFVFSNPRGWNMELNHKKLDPNDPSATQTYVIWNWPYYIRIGLCYTYVCNGSLGMMINNYLYK